MQLGLPEASHGRPRLLFRNQSRWSLQEVAGKGKHLTWILRVMKKKIVIFILEQPIREKVSIRPGLAKIGLEIQIYKNSLKPLRSLN